MHFLSLLCLFITILVLSVLNKDRVELYSSQQVPCHFITFGTGNYAGYANNLKETALTIGGFVDATVYAKNILDHEFRERNAHILNQPRGDGYWLWKPYIIMHMLHQIPNGHILCYCDSLYLFTGNMADYLRRFFHEHPNQDIWLTHNKPHEGKFEERHLTKNDAVVIIGADVNKNTNYQVWAGFIAVRKTLKAMNFIAAWLTYSQDERVVTDLPDTLTCARKQEYAENRHDQTTLSLLAKKWNIPFHDFPDELMSNLRS